MFGHNDASDALIVRNHANTAAADVPLDRLRLPDGNGLVADRFGNWSVSSPGGQSLRRSASRGRRDCPV